MSSCIDYNVANVTKDIRIIAHPIVNTTIQLLKVDIIVILQYRFDLILQPTLLWEFLDDLIRELPKEVSVFPTHQEKIPGLTGRCQDLGVGIIIHSHYS